MIKFENTEIIGWDHALRGMRNPKDSWDKSDSGIKWFTHEDIVKMDNDGVEFIPVSSDEDGQRVYMIGPNDMKLIKNLVKSGPDHRKLLRHLDVYVDITAPLYWWKEFKTYRRDRKFMDEENFYDYDIDDNYDDYDNEMFIEMNSCSTMHRIHAKEFTLDDFAHDHLIGVPYDDGDDSMEDSFCCNYVDEESYNYKISPLKFLENIIMILNQCRAKFIEISEILKNKDLSQEDRKYWISKQRKYWYQMIQLLPSSYMQKRTVKMSLEVVLRMYKSRYNHKLDEWKRHEDGSYYGFCDWVHRLDYSNIITGEINE